MGISVDDERSRRTLRRTPEIPRASPSSAISAPPSTSVASRARRRSRSHPQGSARRRESSHEPRGENPAGLEAFARTGGELLEHGQLGAAEDDKRSSQLLRHDPGLELEGQNLSPEHHQEHDDRGAPDQNALPGTPPIEDQRADGGNHQRSERARRRCRASPVNGLDPTWGQRQRARSPRPQSPAAQALDDFGQLGAFGRGKRPVLLIQEGSDGSGARPVEEGAEEVLERRPLRHTSGVVGR